MTATDTSLTRLREQCCAGERSIYDPPRRGYSAAEGLMLVAEEAVEIRVLRRQGKSIRAIARTLWARTQRGALKIKILRLL